jgi:hypothetical protein
VGSGGAMKRRVFVWLDGGWAHWGTGRNLTETREIARALRAQGYAVRVGN